MNTINREIFEAWLAMQSEDRLFIYLSCKHCVVGSFIAETTNITDYLVGCPDVFLPNRQFFTMPEWIINLLRMCRPVFGFNNIISVKDLKENYRKLFPSTKWDLSPSLTSLLNLEEPKVDEEKLKLVEAETTPTN